jgi:hypothetical protein
MSEEGAKGNNRHNQVKVDKDTCEFRLKEKMPCKNCVGFDRCVKKEKK